MIKHKQNDSLYFMLVLVFVFRIHQHPEKAAYSLFYFVLHQRDYIKAIGCFIFIFVKLLHIYLMHSSFFYTMNFISFACVFYFFCDLLQNFMHFEQIYLKLRQNTTRIESKPVSFFLKKKYNSFYALVKRVMCLHIVVSVCV